MYKAAKQFGMKFRVSWHWNVVAGDPYYALDCREDDYAWCNMSPAGDLIPSVEFEQHFVKGSTITAGCSRWHRWLTETRARRPRKPARS